MSYKLLYCLLLKSPVVTGLPFNTQNHLSVLILLSLATRVEPATHFNKANSPLQGDKQSTEPNKLCHVSSSALFSCSEEETFSFNLLQLLRLWSFCFNLYYTLSRFCVCATSPVGCSMYFQSFCCAFILHTGLTESICYTLTQISPNDIRSWFLFSLHCTENVSFEGKCFHMNTRTRRTLKPLSCH